VPRWRALPPPPPLQPPLRPLRRWIPELGAWATVRLLLCCPTQAWGGGHWPRLARQPTSRPPLLPHRVALPRTAGSVGAAQSSARSRTHGSANRAASPSLPRLFRHGSHVAENRRHRRPAACAAPRRPRQRVARCARRCPAILPPPTPGGAAVAVRLAVPARAGPCRGHHLGASRRRHRQVLLLRLLPSDARPPLTVPTSGDGEEGLPPPPPSKGCGQRHAGGAAADARPPPPRAAAWRGGEWRPCGQPRTAARREEGKRRRRRHRGQRATRCHSETEAKELREGRAGNRLRGHGARWRGTQVCPRAEWVRP
jgi:hypothetical protein